ncbi:hypothetical protein ABE15_20080 [Bacillus cereus]|nr:hypothetical protein [Bacillus cereus]
MVQATVRRNASGRYFVSLLGETDVQKLPKIQFYLGMDVGLKGVAIFTYYEICNSISMPKI